MNRDVEFWMDQIAEAQARIAELEEETNRLNAEIADLQSEIADLRGSHSRLQADKTVLETDVLLWAKRAAEATRTLMELLSKAQSKDTLP